MSGCGGEYAWVVVKIADVKWIKIVTDVFDDEKILLIESMPEHDAMIVIWFKLLCLAGKNNNKGVFTLNNRIAYTDEMISTIFRRPLNTVRLALKTFEQYGMIELINGVITIPNWGKHQTLDQLENKREYMREYMSKKRSEQKLLASGDEVPKTLDSCKTNSKTNVSTLDKTKSKNKKEKEIKNTYTNDFEIFWSAYPRKTAKVDAFKAWNKIQLIDVLFEKIMIGLTNAIKSVDWVKDGGKFIPYPATWLNGERWNDEVQEAQVGLFGKPIEQELSIAEKARRLEEDYERRHGIKADNFNKGYISIV